MYKVPKMYKFTDILHSFIKINNTLNIALTRPLLLVHKNRRQERCDASDVYLKAEAESS